MFKTVRCSCWDTEILKCPESNMWHWSHSLCFSVEESLKSNWLREKLQHGRLDFSFIYFYIRRWFPWCIHCEHETFYTQILFIPKIETAATSPTNDVSIQLNLFCQNITSVWIIIIILTTHVSRRPEVVGQRSGLDVWMNIRTFTAESEVHFLSISWSHDANVAKNSQKQQLYRC